VFATKLLNLIVMSHSYQAEIPLVGVHAGVDRAFEVEKIESGAIMTVEVGNTSLRSGFVSCFRDIEDRTERVKATEPEREGLM
jgi:hypothetical protein